MHFWVITLILNRFIFDPIFISGKGLVWDAREDDIRTFLHDCSIKDVILCKTINGSPSGEALVELETSEDTLKAKAHNRQYLRTRFVIIEPITEEAFQMEKNKEEAQPVRKKPKPEEDPPHELDSFIKVRDGKRKINI